MSVFLDGEYAFGVARIVAAWLYVGQVLTEQKMLELQQSDVEEIAYQKALHLLSYRPRSEQEIRKKLSAADLADPVIDVVLERLRTAGLVSDPRFAREWVENRNTFRPRGRRLMALELKQKGVAEDVIQDALATSEDEELLAYQAAIRHARKWTGLEWGVFRDRLSAFLGRRGFTYGTIKPVVRQVWLELHSDESSQTLEEKENE